jgi:putative ABC transport system permease protein
MMDRSTVRVALRTLGRHKGFTTVAILSLAVAIALNTVMYSVSIAMLAPAIGVNRPEHIYSFFYYGNFRRQLSLSQVEDALLAGSKDLLGVTGAVPYRASTTTPVVQAGENFRRIQLPQVVRPNFFEFLGVSPLEGRTFRASDETEGGSPVVISRRLAQNVFPAVSPLGESFLLDGKGYIVIGVVEHLPKFSLLQSDVWMLRQESTPPVPINLLRFNRVLDDFALDQQLKLAAARLAWAAGEPTAETAFRGKQIYTGDYNSLGPLQLALIGAVVAVLLVACANLANLQLARGLARGKELALRSAVGATRRQLIQLLMLESGILAASGLALGIVLTLWGVSFVRASIPEIIADLFIAPTISWAVFVFAAVAAVVCLLLVGLVPALRISRVDPADMLKSGSGTGANRENRRRYGMMVIAQVGFALPVLIGSVLLLRGSYKLHSRDYLTRYRYGYDPAPIVVGSSSIVHLATAPPPSTLAVANELLSSARAIPGVIDAAVYVNAWTGRSAATTAELNGTQKEFASWGMSFRAVTPSYFRTMGIGIARGRGFTETEAGGNALVIDSRTAKYLFGDTDPIGRRIKFGFITDDYPWFEVVGVRADKRSWKAIEARDPYAGFRMSEVYRVIRPTDTLRTYPGLASVSPRTSRGSISIYARVQGSAEVVANRLLLELRSIRGGQRAMAEPFEVNSGIAVRRQATDFVAALFTTFGLIGMALVAIGVYGIVSHSIEERRREIAVRISMGATARDVLHAVLREGNVLILAGVALGLLFAKFSVWWLVGFIDELDGYHAMLFAYISAALFALAAIAALFPAIRATRIDPVEALRHE